MMIKGKEPGEGFSAADLPKRTRMNEVQKQAWIDEKNARYAVVAVDEDTGDAIIAEELPQRILNRLSAKARRVVGQIMLISDEAERSAVAREVIGAFNADGSLKNPFKPV